MADPGAEPPRTIPDPGLAADDGAAPPALAAALAAYDEPGGHQGVLRVLGRSRLLIPVVAALGEAEVDAQGRTHEKSSDMSTVLMRGTDGRIAQLAYSSLAALQEWNPQARPVPALGAIAARAALDDGAVALLLDYGTRWPVVVETDDLRAIAAHAALVQVGGESIWILSVPE